MICYLLFFCGGESIGIIYGIDFDRDNNVIYYGDRNNTSIWSVSIDRITNLDDGRFLLVSNTTVWGIAYDWINGFLYWTDDV